ncbi:MAG: PEP/pyruvate-binding domain-containing protein [Candidatus Dojkabacteria bacterium]|nr:PEP/pyruvate-binding domain-containing protein [Candidatus Dojkabacteria bacterium]
MENTEIKKSNVFFCEDFSAKDLNENKVGRKGLSLFKLKDMDVPVPDFFVISGLSFVNFCLGAFDTYEKKLLDKGKNPENEEVEDAILKYEFPKDVQEEILSAYTRLSGFTDAWVSVRSSVIFPEKEEVSFSGIFATQLNVRKFPDLLNAIKRVFSSMFTDDVVSYAQKMNIDLADVKIAVVVQRMVQSEISGVVFTTDPITQDETKLSIEAVFGLGDVISLGEITPDTYVLNKKDLTIVEKHISPQEWMKVRTMKANNGKNEERIKISSNWSHRQKVNDKDMKEISKIALIIENKSREIQNVEWVISGGRVWILQNKSLFSTNLEDRIDTSVINPSRKTLREVLVGFLEKYRGEREIVSQAVTEAQKMVKREGRFERLIQIAKQKKEKIQDSNTDTSDLLLSGIGASFGTAQGKVTIVDGPVDNAFTKEDILLIKKYSSDMETMIIASGGVIMDTGGLTSDTAILCRECKIPAVVGTQKASDILKNGDSVKIDGNTGSIYKLDVDAKEEVHPVVEAYGEDKVGGIDLLNKKEEVIVVKEENELNIPRDINLPPSATKIFCMADLKPKELFEYIGDSNGIVYIDLDRIMLEDGRHILSYVDKKKFVDYSSDISKKVLEYVELAQGEEVILSIGSGMVAEFKALTGGKEYENPTLSNEVYGGVRYVNNIEILRRVLRIIKRIRTVYKKRNVSLALHCPMNEDIMKEFKRILLGEKLKRTSSFKIYAILDNPAEIILADDIVDTKIDGLILNMPLIARQVQGIDIRAKNAKYDLNRNSIFKIVESVLEEVKRCDTKVIVVAENSKPLIKYCVEVGVYGISVFAKDIKEARNVVYEEESKLILSK